MVFLVLPLTLCLWNVNECEVMRACVRVCGFFVLYTWILSNKFSTRMNRLLPAINIFHSSVIEYHKQNKAHQLTRAHTRTIQKKCLYVQLLFWLIFLHKHENKMADWVLFNIDFEKPQPNKYQILVWATQSPAFHCSVKITIFCSIPTSKIKITTSHSLY